VRPSLLGGPSRSWPSAGAFRRGRRRGHRRGHPPALVHPLTLIYLQRAGAIVVLLKLMIFTTVLQATAIPVRATPTTAAPTRAAPKTSVPSTQEALFNSLTKNLFTKGILPNPNSTQEKGRNNIFTNRNLPSIAQILTNKKGKQT
jgi:hypothetical protein